MDLKAAFDNVERENLWEILQRKGVKRNLIGRLRRIYEETRSAVRTKESLTKEFISRKGVRQGCVLRPTLFNLYIADLDRYMRERGVSRIKLGKERVWSLAYADDIVLLAKNREALMDMMPTLRRFIKETACVERREVKGISI